MKTFTVTMEDVTTKEEIFNILTDYFPGEIQVQLIEEEEE